MRRIAVVFFYLTLILALFQRSTEGVDWNEVMLAIMVSMNLAGIMVLFVGKRLRGAAFVLPLLVLTIIWLPLNIWWGAMNDAKLFQSLRRAMPLIAFSTMATAALQWLRTSTELKKAYGTICTASVLAVVLKMPILAGFQLTELQEFRRLSEVMGGYYSVLGATLLFPLAIASESRGIRLAAALGFGISLVGLVLSLTRTYWIVGLISLLTILLWGLGKRAFHRALLLIGSGCALLLVLAPFTMVSFIGVRMKDFTRIANDYSVLNRWQELQGVLSALFDRPVALLLGQGLGGEFTFYSIDPFYPKGSGFVSTDYSHNFYVYVLLQLGMPGFLLWLYPLLICYVRALRTMRQMLSDRHLLTGLIAVLTGLIVANFVAPPMLFTGVASYLGAVIGITWRLAGISQEELQRRHQSLNQTLRMGVRSGKSGLSPNDKNLLSFTGCVKR
ncbi:MAG: O-antigen ligase family protein [Candidatus Methanomethyliaceae archaeon]